MSLYAGISEYEVVPFATMAIGKNPSSADNQQETQSDVIVWRPPRSYPPLDPGHARSVTRAEAEDLLRKNPDLKILGRDSSETTRDTRAKREQLTCNN